MYLVSVIAVSASVKITAVTNAIGLDAAVKITAASCAGRSMFNRRG